MAEDRIWYASYAPGVPTRLDYEKTTLSAALTRSAETFPNRSALNYMGRKISYAELNGLVNAFARTLADLGVHPGDKAAVCLPNIPEAVIANYAIFRIGAVTVQNNPLYTERELAYQLNDSDAKILITLSLLLPRIKKIWGQIRSEKVIACNLNNYLPVPLKQMFPWVRRCMYRRIRESADVLSFSKLLPRYPDTAVEDQSRWENLGALLYTGGTTGKSKGLMLTHANLSSNVQQFAAWFPDLKKGEESLVGNFPIFHSAGFTAIQNYCIWQANEIILVPRPEPRNNIRILKKYRPTFLPGEPPSLWACWQIPTLLKSIFQASKVSFPGPPRWLRTPFDA
ncbi:MAG: AMP-binding protein [Desulfobacterales bacterium]|nr:AMP-binding protein [Desulfobacterales bacterium]MBS3755052.1 AMP-binding protein [Desulfobacterales bacterium]